MGNPKHLSESARLLRADVTDIRALVLYKKLTGGTGFEGSLFLEFENGGALWQLSWHTPEC